MREAGTIAQSRNRTQILAMYDLSGESRGSMGGGGVSLLDNPNCDHPLAPFIPQNTPLPRVYVVYFYTTFSLMYL
ncbi:hypothetical protein J6590_047636 [Homalodisca vitripennis]|nr:hypothetical protein J6590_047636 [Homalodisca vitripennis]